jgi:hypothetical protein
MENWWKPIAIVGLLAVLITINIFEFWAKRRQDQVFATQLEQGSASEQLALRQYRQTQNIEQLLHVTVTMLFSILIALLWG